MQSEQYSVLMEETWCQHLAYDGASLEENRGQMSR